MFQFPRNVHAQFLRVSTVGFRLFSVVKYFTDQHNQENFVRIQALLRKMVIFSEAEDGSIVYMQLKRQQLKTLETVQSY